MILLHFYYDGTPYSVCVPVPYYSIQYCGEFGGAILHVTTEGVIQRRIIHAKNHIRLLFSVSSLIVIVLALFM